MRFRCLATTTILLAVMTSSCGTQVQHMYYKGDQARIIGEMARKGPLSNTSGVDLFYLCPSLLSQRKYSDFFACCDELEKRQRKELTNLGLLVPEVDLDWDQTMARKDDLVAYLRMGTEAVLKSKGVGLVKGQAAFEAPNLIQVGEHTLQAERFILATGSSWAPLGLETGGSERVVNTDWLLEMRDVPSEILVLGGGPVELEAAQGLAKEGMDVEVLDLRSLWPLDWEAVEKSVSKTHKVVVAHEACVTGAFGAEIAARIQESLFDELDAPVVRVGARRVPHPFSPPSGGFVIPGPDSVADAARRVMGRVS